MNKTKVLFLNKSNVFCLNTNKVLLWNKNNVLLLNKMSPTPKERTCLSKSEKELAGLLELIEMCQTWIKYTFLAMGTPCSRGSKDSSRGLENWKRP